MNPQLNPYIMVFAKGVYTLGKANAFVSLGLYTDESPGLKVDPVVVLVLSLGFIFSVVALHSTLQLSQCIEHLG